MTMKLAEVFAQLTHGELKTLAIGGAEQGVISEMNQRGVANHVVLGLTVLYTRFNLKQGELILQLSPSRIVYPLESKYAVNGKFTVEPVRWILDTVDAPFRDDIIKIEQVFTDKDFEMSINNESDCYSCATPRMDSIRVPADIVQSGPNLPEQLKTDTLRLKYRANHPNILPRVGYFNPDTVQLELPHTHLQALLYFIASRVHNPIGMANEFNSANNYAAKFEAECQNLGFEGVEIDDTRSNQRARRAGWC